MSIEERVAWLEAALHTNTQEADLEEQRLRFNWVFSDEAALKAGIAAQRFLETRPAGEPWETTQRAIEADAAMHGAARILTKREAEYYRREVRQ